MVRATPHSLADAVLAGTLFVLALVTRFAFLKDPREVVFDEYHFGKFVNGYVLGEYFFDIHPPLGKLLLLLGAWAGGYDGSQGWRSIGEPIGGAVNLFALRAVPAAQGALLPPLLYAAGRAAGLSRPAAVLAPAGVLFDVCCLVEQRLILTDATLLLGIALQLAAAFASDHYAPLSARWLGRVAAEGAGIALAVCTKWTGMSTLGVAAVHSLVALYRAYSRGSSPPRLILHALVRLVLLLCLPCLAYLLSGWIHLKLLPLTGPGAKFMTSAFRATLKGDNLTLGEKLGATVAAAAAANGSALKPNASGGRPVALQSTWAGLVELNREMLRANRDIKKTHKWGSRWWEWPLMRRSVLYWTGKEAPYVTPPRLTHARIYCMGTPIVWWLAALAPTCFVAWAVHRRLFRAQVTKTTTKDAGAGDDPAASTHAAVPPAAGAPAASPSPADEDDADNTTPNAESVAAEDPDAAVPKAAALGAGCLSSNGWLLILGYLVNWLPFILVDRVAFIYHFLPSLLHALLLVGVLLDITVPSGTLMGSRTAADPRLAKAMDADDGANAPEGVRWLVAGCIVHLMAACFAYFAPLAYGIPLSEADFKARMWLPSWE
jgi:dolichyl-phosphate-mannose--protein O-mannosyl transferase